MSRPTTNAEEEGMHLPVASLTRHETLALWRRRKGLKREALMGLGLTWHSLRAMEREGRGYTMTEARWWERVTVLGIGAEVEEIIREPGLNVSEQCWLRRRRSGLTLKGLARKLRVSPATLFKWEHTPTCAGARRLAAWWEVNDAVDG